MYTILGWESLDLHKLHQILVEIKCLVHVYFINHQRKAVGVLGGKQALFKDNLSGAWSNEQHFVHSFDLGFNLLLLVHVWFFLHGCPWCPFVLDVLQIKLVERHDIDHVFWEMGQLSSKRGKGTAPLISVADEDRIHNGLIWIVFLHSLDNMLDLLVQNREQKSQLNSSHLVVPDHYVFRFWLFYHRYCCALQHCWVNKLMHGGNSLGKFNYELLFDELLHALSFVEVAYSWHCVLFNSK